MRTVVNVLVKDVVGPNAMTLDDGSRVFAIIRPKLGEGEVVELDFSGVDVFASPFFNAAISRLLSEFSSDFLNEHLPIKDISPVGDDLLRRSLENAKSYYATSDADRSAIDAVVRRAAG